MDLDAQIAELEKQVAEAEAMQHQQQQQQQHMGDAAAQQRRFAKDADDRSIFVGNLPQDASLTPEEVAQFFSECGPINNCTLLRDRTTGQLKGTAYVEFATFEAVGRALDAKQNAIFRGQNLIINKKRSNFDPTRARGRGRGRGVMGMPGDPMTMMAAMMGMMQNMMGGGRGGMGRGGPGMMMGGMPRGRGMGRGRGGGRGAPRGGGAPF